MTDALDYTGGMTDNQKVVFLSEYNQRRKDSTIGVILAIFLGGFGLHRFYMGQTLLGVIYLVFCWTFIPAFVSLIEAFLMPGRVRGYNDQVATELAAKIQLMSGHASAS